MSQELIVPGRNDVPVLLAEQMQMAKLLSGSGLVPQYLIGKPENVMLIMLHGRALDIPMTTALQHIISVDGKLSMTTDLMKMLVQRERHTFRVAQDGTDGVAEVHIIRKDDPDYTHVAKFTDADIPDELKKKNNWNNYQADMLVARATSRACRRACADALGGLTYAPEDIRGGMLDQDPTPPVKRSKAANAVRAQAQAALDGDAVEEAIEEAELVEQPSEAEQAQRPAEEDVAHEGAAASASPAADTVDVTDAELVQEPSIDDQPFPPQEITPVRKAIIQALKAQGLEGEVLEGHCLDEYGKPLSHVHIDDLKALMESNATSKRGGSTVTTSDDDGTEAVA